MDNSSRNNLTALLYQGLSCIPTDWQLCLLNGKKVPQGVGWQQKPLTPTQMKEAVTNGWMVDKADGTQYLCYPKGYGLITGTPVTVEGDTYYLMALDQDGASAKQKILELSCGEELPKTVAFTSGRPGRCQYLFLVPEQYAEALRTKKFSTGVIGDDGKDEQLELRWTGLQSCLPPSVHPTTGQYIWVPDHAPDETSVAQAPLWIMEAMLSELLESENPNNFSTTSFPSPRLQHQEQWTDIDWALSYLAALSPSRTDDYNEWCTVGMILKSIDDSLLYEWNNWSRQSSKYKPGECEKKWKSFKRNGVSIRTLAYWAKQDGWTSPFKRQTIANNGKNTQQSCSQQFPKNGKVNHLERNENNSSSHNGSITQENIINNNDSNSDGNSSTNNHHFLYDQVKTIVTSDINPPQQTAALIELSAWDGYPLKGVKDLAGEIETYISRQENQAEDVIELGKLLNYRQQKLDITQILPSPLAQVLLTKANSDRIDPVYLYQYLLAACGSEMGGHIGLLGKEGATLADGWVEYPIFWTMVVALASAGKSQTMRSVFSPIKRRYKQAKVEYKKLKEQLKILEESWEEKSSKEKEQLKNGPDNPRLFKATMPTPPPKQLIEAGSPEGALRRMSELTPQSGCTWVFDELVRLLKLDQYKDKGGDTRQILLQTWNAPSDIEFERSNDEDSFDLKDVCLNLTGATQLAKVKQLFSDPDDGDGLISRFLIAVPTTPHDFAVWSDTKVSIDQELQELYCHLRSLHRQLRESAGIESTHETPILLSFSREAQQRWQCWWEEIRRNQQAVEFENPAFYAYLGKMLSQTLRLALLLHCMELKYEQKNNPFRVGTDTLERAIRAAKFSIGQFRILQTNNHTSDEIPGRLSLIHAYALRKGTEVSAVQVQNTVFKRAKPKPALAEIRQDFATLTEYGYAVLSGQGKDLRIKAIPIHKARVGIPKTSDSHSDSKQELPTQARKGTQYPTPRYSENSDDFWADPISTQSPGEKLNQQENSQNSRNCRNSDGDMPLEADSEPLLEDSSVSEICRNDVGNSDNHFDEDSGIELTNKSDNENSDISLENQSEDGRSDMKLKSESNNDSGSDDEPSGNGNIPKLDNPSSGGGNNEILNENTTQSRSQSSAETTTSKTIGSSSGEST